jgi:DNA-binding NtrC family response regulator
MENKPQNINPAGKKSTNSYELMDSSNSQLMQDIYSKAISLSKMDTNLIIIGEPGSGKKSLAHFIHKNSRRADKPFYSFSCLGVDETTYKNAFRERLHFEDEYIVLKYDAIEKAEQGVIYLDHFSELPLNFMYDIIRSYLNSSNQLFRYDKTGVPRLILSLDQEKYHKIFTTDTWKNLLHLIDSVAIMIPPLRERKEDIPLLIDYFLDDLRKSHTGWDGLCISEGALAQCCQYKWPGNILQLKHVLMQGAVFADGTTIEVKHLPFSMFWKLPYEFNG